MTLENLSASEHTFVGGELCLDFANTADWHASDSPEERLKSYEDFVAWGVLTHILDGTKAKGLLREASKRAPQALAALKRAISLRESMYRIFVGIVNGRTPQASDVETLNDGLSKALRHLRIARTKDQFIWDWAHRGQDFDCILWPVLRSAADVLTSDKRTRIGQCADDRGCGWLFLDTSKNHSRRWCTMEDCGNRAKALRHYQRARRSGRRRGARTGGLQK